MNIKMKIFYAIEMLSYSAFLAIVFALTLGFEDYIG